MKKILIPLLVAALLLTVFVACGGTKDEIKDDITTMMNEASTALDDLGDELTENGNVTEDRVTTGEDLTDEMTTDEDMTTDVTEEGTTEENLLGDVTE